MTGCVAPLGAVVGGWSGWLLDALQSTALPRRKGASQEALIWNLSALAELDRGFAWAFVKRLGFRFWMPTRLHRGLRRLREIGHRK